MSVVTSTPGTPGSAARWRKLLLRRRQEVSFAFEKLWRQYFPQHDHVTLRLKHTARSKTESYWEGQSWRKAAHSYHGTRQDRTLLLELDQKKINRLRRLLSNDTSADAAWQELNAPENRAAPQVTIEAIMVCVRKRGIKALEERANIKRLSRCDESARAQINSRIARIAEQNDGKDRLRR